MHAVSAKALELLRSLKLFGKPGCLAGLFCVSANRLFVQAANGEMVANRVFAPNGKLQIAKCKLQIGKWKILIALWFFDFTIFSDFFNKLTLKHVNALP